MKTSEFQSLIEKNTALLQNLAFQLTGDANNAKDLYQDTMLKIICNEGKFDINTNFKNWSHTIMKNTLINIYRKNVRHPLNLLDANEAERCYPLQNSTYNEGLSHLNMEFLSRAINGLEDKFRAPFKLYIEGMKYEEMADVLHVPVERLRSLIFKARELLQVKLKEYRYEITA